MKSDSLPQIAASTVPAMWKSDAITQEATQSDVQIKQTSNPWHDPVWRAARFNEAILRVEAKYGRLFLRLKDWPPERREALKRLMAENELRIMQTALSDTSTSEAGTQIRIDTFSKTMDENTRELRDMMGETDYAKLERFEQERAAREPVSAITNAMRSRGTDVSGDLEESILSAYAAALQDAIPPAGTPNPRMLTPAQQTDLSQKQHQAFQLILLRRMAGVLKGEQLNIFMEAAIEQQEPVVR